MHNNSEVALRKLTNKQMTIMLFSQIMWFISMSLFFLFDNVPNFAHHGKILQDQVNEFISVYFSLAVAETKSESLSLSSLSFTDDEFWQNLTLFVLNWEFVYKFIMGIVVLLTSMSICLALLTLFAHDNQRVRACNLTHINNINTVAGHWMLSWGTFHLYLVYVKNVNLPIVEGPVSLYFMFLYWLQQVTFVGQVETIVQTIHTFFHVQQDNQDKQD